MVPDNNKPRLQANFFCTAPICNGDCFQTNRDAMITVGENLGLIKSPIKKFNIKKPIK